MARDVVVVLNYKGRTDTLDCLQSLVAGSPAAEVLVVDNGSDDGVLSFVRQRWPNVRTLQLEENRGFAGGMNAGIRWAIEAGADTVTVLNNDTLVPPGVIGALSSRRGRFDLRSRSQAGAFPSTPCPALASRRLRLRQLFQHVARDRARAAPEVEGAEGSVPLPVSDLVEPHHDF